MVNWLGKQLDESFVLKSSFKWENKNDNIFFSNNILGKKQIEFYEKFPEHYQTIGCKTWMYNIEDWLVEEAVEKIKQLSKFLPAFTEDNITNVVVLRDPYNLFASRVNFWEKSTIPEVESICRFRQLWKNHANQRFNKNTIMIYYNKWFVDKNYRTDVCRQLNIEFSDAGINDVVGFGDGSSFDFTNFNGKANKMCVLTRYKQISSFESVDSEMIAICKTLFNDIPTHKIF